MGEKGEKVFVVRQNMGNMDMDHTQMKGMKKSKNKKKKSKSSVTNHTQMKGVTHPIGKMNPIQRDTMNHKQMKEMDSTTPPQIDIMNHEQMKEMDHPMDKMTPSQMDSMNHQKMEGITPSQMDSMNMNGMDHSQMSGINMSMDMNGILLTELMSQEGSGTSWQPESSPMYMWMQHSGQWMIMEHGVIMPRYDHQGSPRGTNKFDAPNMFMVMAEHKIGVDGNFTGHLMMSLDPLTESPKGYPLLLQTGESYHGEKLIDIQHPHDLFDEVAIAYSHRLSEKKSAFIYLGYPGEPALGAPVFMHRLSAMANPNAPLSHHWVDATHITFGVATAGLAIGDWKIEASYFNGTEPDDNRYDFDKLKLNSYSGRLSFNPYKDLALQISSGFVRNPEGDGIDIIRSTASAIYTKNYNNGDWWSSTITWGENHEVHSRSLESFLIESQYNLQSWIIYGRGEYVQKTNGELSIPENQELINNISEITLGVAKNLFHFNSLDIDLGVQGIVNFLPSFLQSLYSEHPFSYEIYLSIHPPLM